MANGKESVDITNELIGKAVREHIQKGGQTHLQDIIRELHELSLNTEDWRIRKSCRKAIRRLAEGMN